MRLASVCLSALVVSPVEAQCARYQVETVAGPDCPFSFSQSSANAISPTGELCGGYSTCNGGFGGVWLGHGGWSPLVPPPGMAWITPTDINSSRQMAAFIPEPSNPEVQRRAAFYDFASSTLIDLGHLPGDDWSESYAINEDGTVCGYSANSITTGIVRAFVWENSQSSALNLPLGPNSVAYGIADTGAVCGWMGIAPHVDGHVFIWSSGQTTDLGAVLQGAIGAEARGISPNGKNVCGYAGFLRPVSTRFAFLWRNGTAYNLGVLPLPGHDRSIAFAVNDDGIVVGHSSNSNFVGPAFVWRNGVMKGLNDLIPPGHQLNIDRALSINNAGQIAGSARKTDGSNDQVAIRLTPIQPPPGDCDCNGHVGIHDLLDAIRQWGPAIPTTTADFDNSGTVNIHDLLILIANWD